MGTDNKTTLLLHGKKIQLFCAPQTAPLVQKTYTSLREKSYSRANVRIRRGQVPYQTGNPSKMRSYVYKEGIHVANLDMVSPPEDSSLTYCKYNITTVG